MISNDFESTICAAGPKCRGKRKPRLAVAPKPRTLVFYAFPWGRSEDWQDHTLFFWHFFLSIDDVRSTLNRDKYCDGIILVHFENIRCFLVLPMLKGAHWSSKFPTVSGLIRAQTKRTSKQTLFQIFQPHYHIL